MRSKPDKNKTAIYIVTNMDSIRYVKDDLLKAGIVEKTMVVDTNSKNLRQTCDSLIKFIKDRINPPKIYFVGSTWQREAFDSIVPRKLKGYVVQFDGAIDNRSVVEIDTENSLDAPKKGIQFYKKQAKEKAANLLLNILFQNERESRR